MRGRGLGEGGSEEENDDHQTKVLHGMPAMAMANRVLIPKIKNRTNEKRKEKCQALRKGSQVFQFKEYSLSPEISRPHCYKSLGGHISAQTDQIVIGACSMKMFEVSQKRNYFFTLVFLI